MKTYTVHYRFAGREYTGHFDAFTASQALMIGELQMMPGAVAYFVEVQHGR